MPNTTARLLCSRWDEIPVIEYCPRDYAGAMSPQLKIMWALPHPPHSQRLRSSPSSCHPTHAHTKLPVLDIAVLCAKGVDIAVIDVATSRPLRPSIRVWTQHPRSGVGKSSPQGCRGNRQEEERDALKMRETQNSLAVPYLALLYRRYIYPMLVPVLFLCRAIKRPTRNNASSRCTTWDLRDVRPCATPSPPPSPAPTDTPARFFDIRVCIRVTAPRPRRCEAITHSTIRICAQSVSDSIPSVNPAARSSPSVTDPSKMRTESV
ncbi:hypothetical protein K438DRAFT_2025344 [Mycena galopus ATCC 62051]|nr:hypothetical protein K438DRAFT_2025344 [Mycena galopus ATCC 62051]